MKALRIAASLLLATTGVAGISLATQSAQAADKNTISVGPANPISGEEFEAKGFLSTPVPRTVILQRKSNGEWVKVEAITSTPSGFYRLRGKTSVDRAFRMYAPKSGDMKAIYGPSKTVKLVSQKTTLTLTPSTVTKPKNVEAFIQVSPIREGRAIQLRIVGQDGIIEAVQNEHGRAKIIFGTGDAPTGTFKLYAKSMAANGASGKSSPEVTLKIKGVIISP